jgi:hypothetical protein
MYDINGDGKITRSEMRQAVKRFLESVRKMKKAQYQQMAKFMEVSNIQPILVFIARVNAILKHTLRKIMILKLLFCVALIRQIHDRYIMFDAIYYQKHAY